MKKIININLSGRVIPIEDSAYEKLQAYIESLRRYFANEEGRDEIINDIESRIAELMNEQVRKGSGNVTDDDVATIIASMGRPEDFAEVDSEGFTGTTRQEVPPTYTYTEEKKRGRLYRDTSNRMLGGVCSGLASYLNIDPAIVRILFAIFGLGGWGILIYVLMWIFLPSKDLEYSGKRLYRNPDDRVIGGVASGLAAYFNRDVKTVRLIFVAPLLLNILFSIISWPFFHEGAIFPNFVFGSLTSTFIFTYIILWIVLPEARSNYQRMEMRGEKVDVNTIRQNVQERAKEFGDEVKTAAQNLGTQASEFANTRGRTFVTEARDAARRTGSGFGRFIGLLFRAFFLFIAGAIAFGLFVGLMALIFGGIGFWPLKNFILNGVWQNIFAWGTLLFFLAVPLIAFITWLVRRMIKVRTTNSYLGWTFGGLWVLGWICAALLVASVMNDFRRTQKEETQVSITQPQNKMVVMVNEPEVNYEGDFWWFDNDAKGWDIDEDSLRMANVKLRIEKSDDSNYHVIIGKYSQGKNVNDALNRARNIHFVSSYSDSVLNLGSGITIGKEDKFRAQRLMVIIQVPVGKKILFDESVDRFHPVTIRVGERRGRRGYRDADWDWDWDNWFNYETNVEYVMNSSGELIDPKNPPKPKVEQDNIDEQQQRKNRQQELKDELKKLEQQEKQDSIEKRKQGVTQESLDESDDKSKDATATSLSSLMPLANLIR